MLRRLVFTPEIAALLLQTPIVTNTLSFYAGICAELTPTQFQEVLLHFSPTSLDLCACLLRACHITDELLRALSKNRVREGKFANTVPVDGGIFAVTDDAIVDFCMQQDVQAGQEGDEAPKQIPCEELKLYNGSFTKDLFKRLVEASSVSTRTQPLRIVVSPVRFEDENLRDFTQHLSRLWQLRIYDFPGEQHGAIAAMHLQIVLCPDNRLELIRARRPHGFFYEADE